MKMSILQSVKPYAIYACVSLASLPHFVVSLWLQRFCCVTRHDSCFLVKYNVLTHMPSPELNPLYLLMDGENLA